MATATRAMAMRVAGEQRQQGQLRQKANNNQPATGSTKVGSGWQESVDKATTQPRWWATMNDDSVQQMMMAPCTPVPVLRQKTISQHTARQVCAFKTRKVLHYKYFYGHSSNNAL